jgi:hypothetical protein
MAQKYSFRPKYYTNSGQEISLLGIPVYYISPVVPSGGNGAKETPYNTFPAASANMIHILANGVYHGRRITLTAPNSNTRSLYSIGNGMQSTCLDENCAIVFSLGSSSGANLYLKDLTLIQPNILTNDIRAIIYCYNCKIEQPFPGFSGSFRVSRCVLQFPNNSSYFTDQGQNSYISTNIVNVINSLALYGNCNVTLDTQARLTTYLNTYAAFNDCRFKLGNEADWTALDGTDEASYRADFVARCQAQGWTVPAGTEYGDTAMPMYRWVFANDSSKNGVPVLNGIIHNFEKRRFVTFGYETKRTGIVVSTDPAAINSFNPATPGGVLELADNAMTFPAGQDITGRVVGRKQSNIMWLGGKVKLTALDIVHNMPAEFGIMVDNTSTIDFTPVSSGSIQPDELYIIRSTDKQYAAITYNGVAYNTALANNVQVFKGVTGQAGFAVTSGNPVIYRITDFVQHQTISMRIVNKLPADIIRSGNLNANYWYFVEHDTDQTNTADHVTYKGVNYPARSSFLCGPGDLTFAVSGDIHLRRCWDKDFNFDTEAIDKEFWRYEQKPKWCRFVLGDTPRCFMTANNNRQNEMQTDENGEYLTTGNPAFYPLENMSGGLAIPSFPAQGTFIQFSLEVTTVNPE